MKPHVSGQERREGQENEPSNIYLYALDYDQTYTVIDVERPRDDGKGTYTASVRDEFDKPVHYRALFWEGHLWQEKDGKYVHGPVSHNSRINPKELADNLAINLRGHRNPTTTRPYRINPAPSEEITKRIKTESERIGNVKNYQATPLTPDELQEFQEAFKKIIERD